MFDFALEMFTTVIENKRKLTYSNFSLKEVEFNKKKALPFFLVLELLTKQKCVATLSTRNLIT